MKKRFCTTQWWRSPAAIVISVIASAALLFLSGRAAVMAFAEGENTITLTFHANGGTGTPPSSIIAQPGEYVTLPSRSDSMTKDGYTHVLWSKTTDTSGQTYYVGGEDRFYEDTDLYAIWEKNLTVTFDLNGGTGHAPSPVIITPYQIGCYNSIVMPDQTEDMARDGYRFVAWDTAPDCSGTTYYPGTTYNIEQDTRLYVGLGGAGRCQL